MLNFYFHDGYIGLLYLKGYRAMVNHMCMAIPEYSHGYETMKQQNYTSLDILKQQHGTCTQQIINSFIL